MSNLFSFFSPRSRRWYPVVSLVVALGIWLGQPVIAQAFPWGDLILQGIQLVQLSNVSDKQEVQLGQQINGELVNQQVRLYRDPNITRYVDQVGQRLAAQSGRSNIPYTFQVVDDDSVNAFATMGGFVYVNKGLLKLADNEAELASVIGHEIGHITAKHALKQMKETALASGVASVAGLNRNAAVAIGVDLALKRPHSRNAEFEADQLGFKTLGRAGYAQSAMVTFMSKLLNQRSVPTFLSSHPATADRVARLKQLVSSSATSGDGLNNAAYRAKVQSL